MKAREKDLDDRVGYKACSRILDIVGVVEECVGEGGRV